MSEFVMLNYGLFDAFVPNILGKHKGNTQKGFEEAHALVLRFLNQEVKNEPGKLFDRPFLEAQTELDSSFALRRIPAPPNIALLKDRFLKEGFEEIERIYQKLKESGNNQPYSKAFYKDYRSWLAWQKDEKYTNRQRLYALGYDSYPKSARINYYLAYYSMRTGQNATAINHYKKALSLVENDPDLTASEKESIINYSTGDLKEIE